MLVYPLKRSAVRDALYVVADRAPLPTDDYQHGNYIGSFWKYGDIVYRCKSDLIQSAEWEIISAPGFSISITGEIDATSATFDKLVLDYGTGVLPAQIAANTVLRVAGADAVANTQEWIGFGGSAYIHRGRTIGGTRAAPSATVSTGSFFNIVGSGHDGTNYVTASRIQFNLRATNLWTPTDNGTEFVWSGTMIGTTTFGEWMRLRDGVLTVSNGAVLGTDPGGSELLRVGGPAGINGLLTLRGAIVGSGGVAGSIGFAGTTTTHYTGDATGYTWRVVTRSGGVDYPYISITDTVNAVRLHYATIIGTDPGGSELLRVGGGVRASSLIVSGKVESSKASAAANITDANASLKLYDAALGAGLFGMQTSGAPYAFQLQVADPTMASRFPLHVNPYGGALIIGTDPGGSELLRVGGSIRSSSYLYCLYGVFGNTATNAQQVIVGYNAFSTGVYDIQAYQQNIGPQTLGLNSLGGAVVLGADPGGSELLRVGGSVRCNTSASVSDKVRMHYDASTGERGMQVKLINKSGANTIKGAICSTTTTDMAFTTTPGDAYDPSFIVYEAGVADASEAWVWCVGSVCEVLLKDSTAATRDYWVKISDTTGRADATNAAPPGGTITALEDHGREVGHCLESKTAGTNVLAKITFHTN